MSLKQLKKELSEVEDRLILEYVIKKYPNDTVFTTSLGPEDQVVTHKISKLSKESSPLIATLDTGRLFNETCLLLEETSEKLGVKIETIFPDYREVEALVSKNGINCFYKSIELRKDCCRIRKIEPLKRILKDKKIWITGVRKQQSTHRDSFSMVEYDEIFRIVKVNPLLSWSTKEVWDYIKKHNVPFNELHKKGYPSIGCACCTRNIHPGEDERNGRWWWEDESKKECGLHLKKLR